MKRKGFLYELKWIGFIAPALVFYLLFFLGPSISAVYYSFTKWDGVTSSFIGLANYRKLFRDWKRGFIPD